MNRRTKSAAPAPTLLDIIRTAAADCQVLGNTCAANELLTAAVMARSLLAYVQCEEARDCGEDIAETVLKKHGFNPRECTPHEFMVAMRRAALAKATGSAV